MSPFSRKLVQPERAAVHKLALRSIAKYVPIAPAWFSAESLRSDRELGKHIRAWAEPFADAWIAVKKQHYNILLSSAEGADLDKVGLALGFPRKAGESDDAYATRVANELTVDRVTPTALEAIIQRLNTNASSFVFEPWTYLKFRNDSKPRSGRTRRSDTRYFRGGVVDLVHDRYVEDYYSAVAKSLAAGVRGYFTLQMEGQTNAASDDLSAVWPDTEEQLGFITNSVEVTIDSVGSFTLIDGELLEQRPVALETNQAVEVMIDTTPQILVTAGLIFENLSRNYRLEADMLQSALTGTPVYTVAIQEPFDLLQHTSIQPAPIILNGLAELDDSWTLGGYGVFM
jgi:hypothetical protein